ncbi:glycosyltransferase family 4 protein [Alteromonas oceanisediminis]|uniref:glycosyltransferase family 4 protein n=1 Tax=Alteromonas oceanisediminis TaxID=2836180 RepID=UPI001BDADF8B|nr:glycosyltransferase family 4 protein [Alteromonas oceanisediminis]MBT0587615.1 glycosyltransferase family 4 protein [Alteromonas oceanisediminis]
MKICAIGLRGIPHVMGGIETHCQALYQRLSEHADIVVLARSPYVKQRAVYRGVNVLPVWTIRNKWLETALHTFIALCYARLYVKPDVVHLHAIGPSLFTPLARLLGFRVVVTHHGADYNRQKWNTLAKTLLRCGEFFALHWAHDVIVVGKSLAHELQQRFPRKAPHIHFIPNGANADFSREAPDIEDLALGLLPENYILTVGRLVPEKGFSDLIEAHKRSGIDMPLVIVGDADHQDEYTQTLRQSADRRVIFAGRQHGDALLALYAHAERFILPSYHEGLPIVALEALSANTPVLLSDIQPNKDIGLTSAHYFETGNIDELARALTRFLPPVNGAAILDKFNWATIAESTLHVFKSSVFHSQQQSAFSNE